jgi:hypothetical protein
MQCSWIRIFRSFEGLKRLHFRGLSVKKEGFYRGMKTLQSVNFFGIYAKSRLSTIPRLESPLIVSTGPALILTLLARCGHNS